MNRVKFWRLMGLEYFLKVFRTFFERFLNVFKHFLSNKFVF